MADENGKAIFKNNRPIPIDNGRYFGVNDDNGADYRRTLLHTLKKMGVNARKSHHEVSPGQQEIVLSHGHALSIADEIMKTKNTAKIIAKQFNFFASFMPYPIEGKNGSGTHFHQNFTDLNGNNVFYDEKGLFHLSKIALSFIAGQLKYIKEILAVLNCEVNSYKRLSAGLEAPNYIGWGGQERSALIRVPPFNSKTARIELRCPDLKCNPYLALALMLAAGLKGVEEELPPDDPVREDNFKMCSQNRLHSSLSEALKDYVQSELVQETLGEHTFQMFLEEKLGELDYYNSSLNEKDFEMSFF